MHTETLQHVEHTQVPAMTVREWNTAEAVLRLIAVQSAINKKSQSTSTKDMAQLPALTDNVLQDQVRNLPDQRPHIRARLGRRPGHEGSSQRGGQPLFFGVGRLIGKLERGVVRRDRRAKADERRIK
jgi:hypothetical protein